MRPTSSGVPKRLMTVRPWSISASYLALDGAVIDGFDEARLNLVDANAMIGEARGEELRDHRDAGLGDAIFAAGDRDGDGVGGGDGDDA